MSDAKLRTTSKCRSCNAPVCWAINVATGKRAPLDVEPTPDGNCVVRFDAGAPDPEYSVVSKADREAITDLTEMFTNHYATCPKAASWRNRARSDPAVAAWLDRQESKADA